MKGEGKKRLTAQRKLELYMETRQKELEIVPNDLPPTRSSSSLLPPAFYFGASSTWSIQS